MDMLIAAERTKRYLEKSFTTPEWGEVHNNSTSYEHLLWMLNEIIEERIVNIPHNNKADKWLGFVQGGICAVLDVDHGIFARINMTSDDQYLVDF